MGCPVLFDAEPVASGSPAAIIALNLTSSALNRYGRAENWLPEVGLKTAMTDRAAETETVHAVVPEQSPNQPENCCPEPATAVSVTLVPVGTVSEQTVPQLMPLGLEVTVPTPLTATLKANDEPPEPGALCTNVAVTLLAALTLTVQFPAPLQSPDQVENE